MQPTAEKPTEEMTFRYFDDTVTATFKVEVQPGKFFTGQVRPPVGKELSAYLRKLRAAKEDDVEQVRAEFYARHLKSWNYERPVSVENVAAMPAVLYAALDSVVCDARGCDLVLGKPDASLPS